MDSKKIHAKLRVKRFSIALLPQLKMMRVTTGWGSVADGVLAVRGKMPIGDDYYTSFVNIHSVEGNAGVLVLNQQKENLIQVTPTDVTFWRSNYLDQNSQLSLDRSFEEFLVIWNAVDEIVQMRDIRSISMAVGLELTLDADANAYMFKSIQRDCPINPRQFRLQYQSRKWLDSNSDATRSPQLETDAFLNETFAYYAGRPDLPGPFAHIYPKSDEQENRVNIDLDIRRFYSPLMETGNGAAFRKQFTHFHKESDRTKSSIIKDLATSGVILDE